MGIRGKVCRQELLIVKQGADHVCFKDLREYPPKESSRSCVSQEEVVQQSDSAISITGIVDSVLKTR